MSETKNKGKEENETPVTENKKELLQDIIVEGAVVGAYFGHTKFDENDKYRLGIESSTIPYDSIHAFDSNGAKLSPKWFKEKTGYINVKSAYDIPVKSTNGKVITFDEWINTGLALGSTVRVKVKQKDGAIYPLAIVVTVNGEESNPFLDM